jgi:hypothetical protein
MTDKEALELSLDMLERDNLKVGNIYVNYDIQKALIKLIKKERKKKEWHGLTAKDLAEIPPNCYEGAIWADAKLKEKNT